MARHTNIDAAHRLGDALRALREQAGRPTYSKIERGLIGILGPDVAPTSETVRRLHSGEADPGGTSPEALLALAQFYGVEPEDLGPEVAERVGALRLLLAALDNTSEVTRRYSRGPDLPTADELTGGDVRDGRRRVA